jgi:hypothetical protein
MWEWILLLLVLLFFGGGALGWFPKFGAYLSPSVEFKAGMSGGIYFGEIGPLTGGGQGTVNQVAQSNGITPIPTYPSVPSAPLTTVSSTVSPTVSPISLGGSYVPPMGPEESLEHYLSRI